MSEISNAQYSLDHVADHYYNVKYYKKIHLLCTTAESELETLVKLLIAKNWEEKDGLAPCVGVENCLYVLGVESIYDTKLLVIVKDFMLPYPFSEVIFLLQVDKSDFDKIPFSSFLEHKSFKTHLANVFWVFAKNLARVFNS